MHPKKQITVNDKLGNIPDQISWVYIWRPTNLPLLNREETRKASNNDIDIL